MEVLTGLREATDPLPIMTLVREMMLASRRNKTHYDEKNDIVRINHSQN